MINGQPYEVIRKSRENQQEKKQSARFVIKKQADDEKVNIPECTFLIDDGIENENHQKEDPKEQPGKKQGGILIIKEYV